MAPQKPFVGLDLGTLDAMSPYAMTQAFQTLQRHANAMTSMVQALHARVDDLPAPPSFDQIRKALSTGGVAPLNLTGLVGTPQALETTNAAISNIPTPSNPNPPPPSTPPGTDPPLIPNPQPTPPPVPGQAGGDAIPIGSITVINSPGISSLRSTGVITSLGVGPNDFQPQFTTQNAWPDVVPPGWGGPLEYTLWMLLFISGQWYGSGVIQFWRGLVGSGGPPQYVGAPNPASGSPDWFYGTAWGPMSGYQPAVGEQVGFLCTAGNQRQGANDLGKYSDGTIANERTNIIKVPYPSSSGQVFTFS